MRYNIIIVIFLIVIFSISYLFNIGVIESLELKTLDARYSIRGNYNMDSDVVVVGIDEYSLINFEHGETEESWPWQRRIYGDFIDILFNSGANLVVFDISFTSKDKINTRNDSYFASMIRKHQNVILGAYSAINIDIYEAYPDTQKDNLKRNIFYLNNSLGIRNIEYINNISPLTTYKIIPSLINLSSLTPSSLYEVGPLDLDGVLRNIPLFFREIWPEESDLGLNLHPQLNLQAFIMLNNSQNNYVDYKERQIYIDEIAIPIDSNGIFQIYYYGKGEEIFKTISFYDVMNNKFDESIFENKTVYVGYTSSAVGLYDLRITPFSTNEPGVYVHANVLQNLINKHFLFRIPFLYRCLILFLILFLSLFLLNYLRSFYKITIYLIPLAYTIISYFLFKQLVWTDVFYPTISSIFLISFDIIKSFVGEYKQKVELKGYLTKYIPDTVAEQLIANKTLSLGGKSEKIVVLFSDIKGFTEKSENLSPQEVVSFLNKYLTAMSEIIRNKYSGTIDKFIGDAIMAIFGAPVKYGDEVERAVRCAIDMRKELKELNKNLEYDFYLEGGIGIHFGEATIGNIGAPFRMDYTAIGDVVNTSSRVEGLTRKIGKNILVTESVYMEVKDLFEFEEEGIFEVKGKKNLLKIYSVKESENE